jgi:hypothetical protein
LKTLVIFENEQQWEAFSSYKKESSDEEFQYVAMTPFAVGLLEEKKITYSIPESYCKDEEYDCYMKQSNKIILDLIERLNVYSRNIGMKKIKFPIEIGTYFSLLLSYQISRLHKAAFIMNNILQAEKPSKIISFKPDLDLGLGIINFLFHPFDSYFTKILINSSWKEKTQVVEYRYVKKCDRPVKSLKQLLKKSEVAVKLVNVCRGAVRMLRCSYFLSMLWRKRKKVLFAGPLYNWSGILLHNKFSRKFSSLNLNLNGLPKISENQKEDIFKKWIEWKGDFLGFDISSVLRRQMKIAEIVLHRLLRDYKKFKWFIQRIDVVAKSFCLLPYQFFVSHIANSINVPTVLWMHGEKGSIFNKIIDERMQDLSYTNYLFTFGEGCSSFYQQNCNGYPNFRKAIATGSSRNCLEKSDKVTKKETIVYPLGKFLLSGPFNAARIISDNKRYFIQKEIVAYLEGLKKEKVVLKLNPTSYHMSQPPLDIRNCLVKDDEISLAKLFLKAKLIILDTATTTCLEACMTYKPVFVLDKGTSFLVPHAKTILKKRAVVRDTVSELIQEIDLFLKSGIYKASYYNREYVKAYFTHLDDGGSVDRATDLLYSFCNTKIINKKKFVLKKLKNK